jgi:diaminopimelate decarboxylase
LDVVKNPDSELYEQAQELGINLEKVEEKDTFNVYGPFCTSVDKIAWNKN